MSPFSALSFVIVLVVAPFAFTAIISRVKARWAGRRGAPLLQPFHDLVKLARKGEVISRTTSFVFRLAPTVSLACTVFAAALIPFPGAPSLFAFPGDFVLFAYVLGLSRFVMILAALDTGSSFEGMGAAREATLATIVEPAFFVVVGSLALASGKTSFSAIFGYFSAHGADLSSGSSAGLAAAYSTGSSILLSILCIVALFIMLLTEGSRVPVDDPNTHLELTMIHEVMILDYSGPDLAFIHYSAWLKMSVIGTLIVDMVLPTGLFRLFDGQSLSTAAAGIHGAAGATGTALLIAGLAVTATAVGLVESLVARARMSHVPQFVFVMTAVALTAFGIVSLFSKFGF